MSDSEVEPCADVLSLEHPSWDVVDRPVQEFPQQVTSLCVHRDAVLWYSPLVCRVLTCTYTPIALKRQSLTALVCFRSDRWTSGAMRGSAPLVF